MIMLNEFKGISDDQFKVLTDAVSWITIYIAGADNEIDSDELDWAKKITEIRSFAAAEKLQSFYIKVGHDFTDVIDDIVKTAPKDVKERTKFLHDKLAQINDILPSLDHDVATELYRSYISFAKHVAKSSGGFLSFMSIGPEEKALMSLEMINPI